MKEDLGDAIDRIETGIRKALNDERTWSQEHGFEQGHYWLHRKIDQVLDEIREHFQFNAWTPHLTNDNDYLRGMAEAFRIVLEEHPETEASIKKRVEKYGGQLMLDLIESAKKWDYRI
jgi:hypothetical protein